MISYLSGAGNIFTVIDNRKQNLDGNYFINNARMLTKPNSILHNGSDGIIVINTDAKLAFNVWFFNPDGSSGMMCGNGGRVAVYYGIKHFIGKYKDGDIIKFWMNDKIYYGKKNDNIYSIIFTLPDILPVKTSVTIDNLTFAGYFVDVGTPHFVIKSNNIDTENVVELGKKIRYNEVFAPNGTNIDFYEVKDDIVYIRTYERGVENETASCGTGTIATAVVHSLFNKNLTSITAIPLSKSKLYVSIKFTNGKIKDITYSGEVSVIT